jgi:O-antigen/teichoic acid export membrane protein
MVGYLSRNVDKILIGKFWNAHQLGLYSKAYAGAVLPIEQASWSLTRVALPTLSRLQDDPDRFRAYFTRAFLLVISAAAPVVGLLIVDARRVVLLVLGEQWLDAVPILRLLAPVAVTFLFAMATRWVFISLGRTERLFRWRAFEALVKISGFSVGVPWGATGVAASMLATSWLLLLPGLAYCFRGSPLTVRHVVVAVWRPLIAALAGAGVLAGIQGLHTAGMTLAAGLAIDIAVLGAVYLSVWVLLPRGRDTLREMLLLVRDLRPSREGTGGR